MDTPAYKIAVSRCIMAGRTAADWKNVAKATRRRRRILQAGHFFIKAKIYDFLVFYVISVS